MKGQRSKCCKSLRDSPYYSEHIYDGYRTENSERKLPHLASCLINKLKAWLLTDGHTFPDNLITAVRSANHRSLVYCMESHVFRDFVFKKAYFALHDSNYLRFHEFWEQYFECHTFYCGVIEKQGLSGEIAKLRGSNCSKCSDHFCPANLAIVPASRGLFGFYFSGYKCPGGGMKSG